MSELASGTNYDICRLMGLKFAYDIAMEPVNVKYGAESRNHGGKLSNFTQKMQDSGVDIDNAEQIIAYCETVLKERSINPAERVRLAQAGWDRIEIEVETILKRLFETDRGIENITAYLSVNDRFGYNPQKGFFFTTIYDDNVNKICVHELLHFYTYRETLNIFKDSGVTNLFNDYKEALTVLLNLEFKNVLSGEDKGHLRQQGLREYIKTTWQSGDTVPEYTKRQINKPEFLAAFPQ